MTNSLRVMNLFSSARPTNGSHTSVILTGGIRTPSDALVGPVADLTVRSLHFDTLFLGCHGIDPDAGLTTPNLAESETNRTFIKLARRVVVAADHTKWGLVSLSSFASLDEIDVLVTDDELPSGIRDAASEKVREIIAAEACPQRGWPAAERLCGQLANAFRPTGCVASWQASKTPVTTGGRQGPRQAR